jgi:DnaD/phage-associated family protein
LSERVQRRFSGFPKGATPLVSLPEQVFTELIPQIDDVVELQVTLLVLWRLVRIRSDAVAWVTWAELCADPAIQRALGDELELRLNQALAQAVARGTLLLADWARADGTTERRYFANGPRGRAAVAAIRRGMDPARASQPSKRPNIFTLYEQNIGPLTALLSEDLMEAEETYPAAWIEEAFHMAVRRNARNWKYIYAILERWRTEGKDEIDRRDRETDTRRYIEGEYSDIIQH